MKKYFFISLLAFSIVCCTSDRSKTLQFYKDYRTMNLMEKFKGIYISYTRGSYFIINKAYNTGWFQFHIKRVTENDVDIEYLDSKQRFDSLSILNKRDIKTEIEGVVKQFARMNVSGIDGRFECCLDIEYTHYRRLFYMPSNSDCELGKKERDRILNDPSAEILDNEWIYYEVKN